jgi:hypothetical protein
MSCQDSTQPLCRCFSSLSNITSLTYAQLQDYTYSWELFRRVELYNSNISTLHSKGDTSPMYWQFTTLEDISSYKTGANLYYQYLGYSNTVQKN